MIHARRGRRTVCAGENATPTLARPLRSQLVKFASALAGVLIAGAAVAPVALAGGGSATAYNQAVLGDSPSGFWPLADSTPNTAQDASGNGNNLSWTGSGVAAG